MDSGAKLIAQEVERWGPMRFDRFVELALYHPVHGYYQKSGEQRGRAGDYFTSLQVSDLFPMIVSEAIISMRKQLTTEQFALIEMGPGNGEFLVSVLEQLERQGARNGLRVWAVEASRSSRARLTRALSRFPRCQVVASLDDIEDAGLLEGCVFSNEFFDALPFRRLRWRDQKWNEVFVSAEGLVLSEVEVPAADVPDELGKSPWLGELQQGHEVEWRDVSPVYESLSGLLSRGYVLTFDYGHPRNQLFAPQRAKGTWLCYHKHETNQEPLQRVGRQDITSHVDFSALQLAGKAAGFETTLYCSQGSFLANLGGEMIERLMASAGETERLKLIRAVQQLMHPDAMGEAFWVMLQQKEAALPDRLAGIPNRARRL